MRIKNLDEFLSTRFIENNATYRKVKLDDGTFKSELVIPLYKINNLKVTDEEKLYAIRFLKDRGIIVRGRADTMEIESDDYNVVRLGHGKIPNEISNEETNELLREYSKTKDISIRNKIVEGNMRLVVKALNVTNWDYNCDYYDLLQSGYIGLIKSIDKYDINKGQFSTFAVSYIIGYIKHEMYRQKGIKQGDSEIYGIIKEVEKEYEESISDNPNLAKIVVSRLIDSGRSKDFYEEYLRKVLFLSRVSLDEILEKELDDETEEKFYHLGYEVEDNGLNDMYEKEAATTIREEINKLKERKRQVLKLYYGIDTNEHTLSEAGKELGISHEGVRLQLESGREELSRKNRVRSLKTYLYKEI